MDTQDRWHIPDQQAAFRTYLAERGVAASCPACGHDDDLRFASVLPPIRDDNDAGVARLCGYCGHLQIFVVNLVFPRGLGSPGVFLPPTALADGDVPVSSYRS